MFEKSIVLKFWLTIVITVVLVLFFLGIGLSQVLENYYYNQIVNNLIEEGKQIGNLIENTLPDKLVEYLDVVTSVLETHIIIVDERGIIEGCDSLVGLSLGEFFNLDEVHDVFKGQIVVKKGFNRHFNTQMLSVAMPVLDVKNRVEYGILMFTPVDAITPTIDRMRQLIVFAAFGGVLLATFIGFIFSKRISKPLLEMNSIALDMARGNFSNEIEVIGQDEIGVLGSTLNYLSARLKDNINQISQEKNKLENVLSGMTDGVISVDKDGYVLFFNPQATNFFCGCVEIKVGSYLFNCNNFSSVESIFREVLDVGKGTSGIVQWSNMYYSIKMSPLFESDDEKTIIGVIIVIQDVTKETKLEQMRKEFIANVSHELRTPLSLIKGYTEALLDEITEDPKTKKEYLTIIDDETIRLRNLVNDLMDLSKMQNGYVELRKDLLNTELLLESIKNKFQKSLEQNNINLVIDVDEDIKQFFGDGNRLAQVFTNLIDNAIRHTKDGDISIRAYLENSTIVFQVEDTGLGINSEDLPYIWERFYKVDKARTRNQSGTGLGLAIVKSIIESHEGTINVESEVGKGTVFTIKFPYNV